jgi:hypothetical protein
MYGSIKYCACKSPYCGHVYLYIACCYKKQSTQATALHTMALYVYGPDIVTATAHSTQLLCQDLLQRSLGAPVGIPAPLPLHVSAQHVVIAHDLFLALAIVMKYRVLLLSGDNTEVPAGLYNIQQLEKRWLRERYSLPGADRFDMLAHAVLDGDFTETHICKDAMVAARGFYGARAYDGEGPNGTPWHVYVRRDFLLFQGRVVNMLRGFMAVLRHGTVAERDAVGAALNVPTAAAHDTLDAKLIDFVAACQM